MPCSLASSAATFFAWSLAASVSSSSPSHRRTNPGSEVFAGDLEIVGFHTWILPQRRNINPVIVLILNVDQSASRQRSSGYGEPGGRGASQRIELVDEVEAKVELGVSLLGLGYGRGHFFGKFTLGERIRVFR